METINLNLRYKKRKNIEGLATDFFSLPYSRRIIRTSCRPPIINIINGIVRA